MNLSGVGWSLVVQLQERVVEFSLDRWSEAPRLHQIQNQQLLPPKETKWSKNWIFRLLFLSLRLAPSPSKVGHLWPLGDSPDRCIITSSSALSWSFLKRSLSRSISSSSARTFASSILFSRASLSSYWRKWKLFTKVRKKIVKKLFFLNKSTRANDSQDLDRACR